MKQLNAFFKKLRLRQILTVFLAGVLLVVGTACNSGDATGARPANPPVQAGGMNNPHKGGGDGYTQYRATDPQGNKPNPGPNRADLQLITDRSIAANVESEILYPGAETPRGRLEKEQELPLITAEDAGKFPERQAVVDRSNPNARILEKTGAAFKEASGFLKETAEEAGARPELKPDPAQQK